MKQANVKRTEKNTPFPFHINQMYSSNQAKEQEIILFYHDNTAFIPVDRQPDSVTKYLI